MIQILKMAFRDLGRNRRRSFFSSLALGVGLALLLLMAAVVTGEMANAMDISIRLQTGHLQVRDASYDEDRSTLKWEDLIESPGQVAAQIAQLEPVLTATPRLFATGVLTTAGDSVGVRLMGIEPDSPANEPYQRGLVEGSYVQADDREGILIGQALADKVELSAGDSVNLLVNTSNGDVAEQAFTVRGVYATGIPSVDQATILLPLAKAQAITQTDNRASTIFILLKDREQTQAVVNSLQTGEYSLLTWEEMNDIVVQTEQLYKGYAIVLYLIVLAITAIVIVNTLVMAVFERTREIGILSAIGMRGHGIMAMFFAESTMLALGGILIGLVLGGLMVLYASKIGFFIGDVGVTGILFGERIYAQFAWKDVFTLSLEALIVTLLASLYPALLAARLEPVEALHGGK